ncbi:MAG: Fic family protein, partial [Muribaculaceae bacterium]|nr:Fic family protein [Muribaculaceae bacterium]
CSKDTAIRDIKDLMEKGILHEDNVGAKRPSYSIYCADDNLQIIDSFKKVYLTQENGDFYLKGEHRSAGEFTERVLPLDAERFQSGDLPLKHLIAKYCSYMME